MTRAWWFAILLIGIAYTALFLSLSSIPLTDAPNHLARAAVMNSLWFDAHSPFQNTFSASRLFMPYMLPDVGLILTIRLLGIKLAAPVWSTLTMLALVFAIWIYARQLLTESWAMAAAMLCSWYLATNYLFILGFFAFQWGVAAAFVALSALEAWRRNKGRGWIALYIAACAFAYGSHVASFAILAAIVAIVGLIRALRRQENWTRLSWELLPFAILSAYQALLVPVHPEFSAIEHSTVADKFGHFVEALFVRENYVIDRSILVLFWAILIVALRRGVRNQELVITCGVATAIYFVLPFGFGGIAYVDERALPFFFIPLLLLALRAFETLFQSRTSLLVVCAVLAIANLVSLALFLPRQNREMALYREALLAIPPGQRVLPINTRARDGNTYPLRHAGAFYVTDREGYIPYLFSQLTGGGPAGYFRDLAILYRPPLDRWPRDWEKVAQSYDYVMITKPSDSRRISHLELWYDNSVATVFRVR